MKPSGTEPDQETNDEKRGNEKNKSWVAPVASVGARHAAE